MPEAKNTLLLFECECLSVSRFLILIGGGGRVLPDLNLKKK